MSDLSAIKLNGTTYTLSDDYARDSMAKIEYGTLATKAYAVGDFLINNNHLYKVTSAIAIGVKFTVGTNIELVKLSDEVKLKAPLASPTFTGTPKVPTASTGTKTTQIASTAYVQNEIDIVNNNVQSTIDYVQNELGGVLTSLRGDLNSLDSEVDTISDDVDSLDSAVNILTRQGTTLRDDGIVVCNAVDGGDNVFFMIDDTLTEAHKAADAKATGDAISSLNEDITNIGKSGNYASGVSYPVNLCTKDFWTGKTGIINGDSIARGIMYIDGSTPVTVEKPFGAYAFEKLGASLIQNYAVGGATLSHGSITVQDTLRTMDKTADIVLISAGSNDCAASRTLGQVGDTTIYTFYGALYVTLTYLRDTYEGKYIFFCTPIQRGAYGATNNNGNTLNEFRNAIIEMCDQFNIPVVDMLKESHVDPIVRPEIFYDGQHPIQIGHDMMGEYLAGVMTSLANSEIIAKSDYTVKGSFANQIYETLGLYVDENGDISQREDV